MKKSTLLHLRIPFSFFLCPFFLFALSQSTAFDWAIVGLVFFIIHFLIYPASNGYNSFYDKDEESIGGLKNPPPVSYELLMVSLVMDILALLLALLVSLNFSILLLIYGLASKAYSHPAIRFKKYPFLGLFIAVIFQGYFTYGMSFLAMNDLPINSIWSYDVLLPGFLCSAILMASYPLTQIYQHKEDSQRGDMTLSRLLGIRGTLLWSAMLFAVGSTGMIYFFYSKYPLETILLFPIFLSPVALYFAWWTYSVLKDEEKANWSSTMRINLLSSLCFASFFLFLLFGN